MKGKEKVVRKDITPVQPTWSKLADGDDRRWKKPFYWWYAELMKRNTKLTN